MTQALFATEVAMHVLLKSSIVVGCAYLIVLTLRRSSAAIRHAVWCAALSSLLLIPILPSPLPAWQVNAARFFAEESSDAADAVLEPLPSTAPASAAPTPADAPAAGATDAAPARPAPDGRPQGVVLGASMPEFTRATWLLAIWGGGVLVLLVRFVIGFLQALLLRRGSVAVPSESLVRIPANGRAVRRHVRVFYAPRARTPMTYGLLRPIMLLPMEAQGWPADRVRVVLAHEFAHVARWDYATHLLMQLVCVLYWANPLIWLALRRVRTEQEHACDDRVIALGTASCAYAEHLLHIAQTCLGLPYAGAVALAQRHTLKERVRSILDAGADRRPLSTRAGLLALLGALSVAVPLAALQPADPADVERAERLEALTYGTTWEQISAAAYFSVRADSAALRRLVLLTEGADQTVRLAAVSALASYEQDVATHALAEALQDSSERLVAIAEAALETRDTPVARVALERLREQRARTVSREEAPPGLVYLFMEAEKGRLTAPMAAYEDPDASDRAFVYVAEQAGHDAPDGGPGAVTLAFELQTEGDFVVWGRIMSPNDTDNSFFVSIDDSREVIWDVPGPEYTDVARDWTWDAVSARDPETNQIANPIIYRLEAGRHVLRVRNREDGTRLDGLIITNDLAYVPAGIAPATPPAVPQYVWLQAEDAALSHGMRIDEDTDAAGHRFAWLPDGDGNDAPAGGRAAASFSFSLEHPDEFVAWARVEAPHTNDNSFFVSLDGVGESVWHAPGPGPDVIAPEWTWARVPLGQGTEATSLSAGPHTIRFRVREDGTRIDALLVTNDQSFRPRGIGVAPPRRAAFIWREAEDAEIASPMRVAEHREASGNGYIFADQASSVGRPPAEGAARYRVEVSEAGSYTLWGRVSIAGKDGDSFWVRLNDGPWIRWNGIEDGRHWHWVQTHDSDASESPVRFELTPGHHTVEVRYRESGAMLDRLLLTNDLTYVPTGTGAASQGVLTAASRIEVVF